MYTMCCVSFPTDFFFGSHSLHFSIFRLSYHEHFENFNFEHLFWVIIYALFVLQIRASNLKLKVIMYEKLISRFYTGKIIWMLYNIKYLTYLGIYSSFQTFQIISNLLSNVHFITDCVLCCKLLCLQLNDESISLMFHKDLFEWISDILIISTKSV